MKSRLVKNLIILSVIIVLCYYIGYLQSCTTNTKNIFISPRGDVRRETTGYRHGNQCSKYYQFDAPSWTLKFLKPEDDIDLDCKSNLTNVIKGFGSKLKRISYTNGTKSNRGCTAQTKMCKEHAHFDKALDVRIDTPPCCMHHILAVCENFSKELRKHNVLHSVIYGAVLGYVRNKQMTPYDHDVDLMVDGKFWRTDLFYRVVKDLDTLYGHKVTYHGIGGKTNILIHYSSINNNAVDVWPFYENTKDNIRMISIPHYNGMRVPYDMMFPTKLLGISGIKANFPNNPTSYVLTIYGEKAIKNMLTCKTMDGANCLT